MLVVRKKIFYDYLSRLTWLKKRLQVLELHRRGPLVDYSPVPAVQEAIQVYMGY